MIIREELSRLLVLPLATSVARDELGGGCSPPSALVENTMVTNSGFGEV
jgi:hypothetical protein